MILIQQSITVSCCIVKTRAWGKWTMQNTVRDGDGQVCPRPLKDRGHLGWETAPFSSLRSPLLWGSLSRYFSKVTRLKPSWWNRLAPHVVISVNQCAGQTSQLDSLISPCKLIDGHPDYHNLLSVYLPTGQSSPVHSGLETELWLCIRGANWICII